MKCDVSFVSVTVFFFFLNKSNISKIRTKYNCDLQVFSIEWYEAPNYFLRAYCADD